MSITTSQQHARGDVDNGVRSTGRTERHTYTETKLGTKTTEFYVMLVAIAGILVGALRTVTTASASKKGSVTPPSSLAPTSSAGVSRSSARGSPTPTTSTRSADRTADRGLRTGFLGHHSLKCSSSSPTGSGVSDRSPCRSC